VDSGAREKRIKRLWQATFGLGFLVAAALIAIGAYTNYDSSSLLPYVFGSIGIAFGVQLVIFGPDHDRMLARDFPDQLSGVKLPMRGIGAFFIFVGAGMIVSTLASR
jgi:hypothetical protein